MEHRLEKRVRFDAKVWVVGTDNKFIKGYIKNANNDGLYIEVVGQPVKKGETISIQLPGHTTVLRMLGVVVHRHKRGIGVMVAPVSGGLLKQLKKLKAASNAGERYASAREEVVLSVVKG